jgi:S-adenosylmethionine decarboxylase
LDTFATHLLVELDGCDKSLLDDVTRVRELMRAAAEAAGATVVTDVFHRYAPQGVTGVVVIEESHFSVHTWPECGYAAVDFYTCGKCDPERAAELLRRELGAQTMEKMVVHRGLREPGGSLVVHREALGSGDAEIVPLRRQG